MPDLFDHMTQIRGNEAPERLARLNKSIADLEAQKRPADYQIRLLNRLRQERDHIAKLIRATEKTQSL